MSDATTKPILVPCEGSRCPTHQHGHALGICSMCGELVVTEDDGTAYRHTRRDILAMLRRGDFDATTPPMESDQEGGT